jgi:alpha-glucosidase
MALGLGISGQPFVGADIGGFAEDSAPELFARWMQCGALTPFCRNHNHHGRNDQYPWSFGKAVEDICRASLQLRYRLMPALYSTFVIAAETGLPIQRALAIEFQDDPAAWEVDDQFLVGDWLMVAPVTEAGCSARHVYLPKGTWIDWHTDEVSIGPKLVTAPTPMDRIPIHARGGAIVPMWPEAPRSAAGYYPSTIALHVFVPVENGEFHSLLVEDDGVTTAREDGAYVRTELLLRRTGGYLAIEGRTSGKGFAQFRRTEFAIVFHGASPKQAMSNSRGMSPDESGVYRLKNKGESFRFEAAIETVAGPA